MDTEGGVRTGLEFRVVKGPGDLKMVVDGEGLRDGRVGSHLDSRLGLWRWSSNVFTPS